MSDAPFDVHPTLRAANAARQAAWCPDQMPDLSFRGNELAGETGEVCNVIKKLERERQGWRGSRDTVEHLAEELADVVICADLVALCAGVDLEAAVTAKFNQTSESVGLPQRYVPGRTWRTDMENAPRDRVIEVVARVPSATAGFPQYAQWWADHAAFIACAYHGPVQPLVAWAWRERTGWPQEPRS